MAPPVQQEPSEEFPLFGTYGAACQPGDALDVVGGKDPSFAP